MIPTQLAKAHNKMFGGVSKHAAGRTPDRNKAAKTQRRREIANKSRREQRKYH